MTETLYEDDEYEDDEDESEVPPIPDVRISDADAEKLAYWLQSVSVPEDLIGDGNGIGLILEKVVLNPMRTVAKRKGLFVVVGDVADCLDHLIA